MDSPMPQPDLSHGLPAGPGLGTERAKPAGGHPVRSWATRILHLLLLLIVLNQLIGSQFMEFPFPGDPPSTVFALHHYIGLASLAVVTAFWLWAVLRHGETSLARLLPWFSPARLRDIAADIAAQLRRLGRGQAPNDDDAAFASAIHGLGLLAVTAMAVTGTVFFFTQGSDLAHGALSLHKLMAKAIWAYLLAHAGLAVLHHLLGSDILSRMFWIGRR